MSSRLFFKAQKRIYFMQCGSIKESQPENDPKIFEHVASGIELVEIGNLDKKLAGKHKEQKRRHEQ